MSNFKFHPRCGKLVTVFDDGRCAARGSPTQEFNEGLVFSNTPLPDDKVFEIKITKIISSWTGSVKLGVTTLDPENIDQIPPSSPELLNDTWLLSGASVLQNGRPIMQSYGVDLDNLEEGDRVGVMRTREGDLVFYVNSCSQGVAASNIPATVYVVLDLYGKCSQIAIVTDREQAGSCFFAPPSTDSNQVQEASTSQGPKSRDKLRFHVRCGSLVKLSANRRTAERRKPLDEFNNGIVMTHRPLKDDELFEIRIDRLVDKWSGSIEVGVTTHDPSTLNFPATMTNLRSGTIMMSGCGILTNGRGIRHEYGHMNLDELKEGDRIGMVRKSNGELHYYINGCDQGVASNKVPLRVWGVVDLYGMTVRVTIVDPDNRDEKNLTLRRNTSMAFLDMQSPAGDDLAYDDPLLFHTSCGLHAAVVNGGRTAHRPHASEDFNHGVVLTSRTLRANEMFEVVIDQIVQKWAGSIEIGVTTHSPLDLEFPATMTNVRSGTFIMTGNGVMHNGTTIIDDYGQNLDQLKSGDRVGVLRTPEGILHFFVNGIDQGPAASNVPPNVYGVIDLYGQASQATIVDRSAVASGEEGCETPGSVMTTSMSASTMYQPSPGDVVNTDLCFHQLHGRKARILNNGLTACRPHAVGEFNDAIVITNRPLQDGEIFEIVLEKMVERWSGSIEAGVTLIRPEELDFPSTLTDIDYDTWMLSGSTIMRDGELVRNGYPCDLDSLPVGTRLGMARHADGSLHYYVNGRDQGAAFDFVPPNVYAIIDLYGQCAQVSLIHNPVRRSGLPPMKGSLIRPGIDLNLDAVSPHTFSVVCGSSITLKDLNTVAQRGVDFRHGLVFGARQLNRDESFEIRIESRHPQFAGSLTFGFTTREPPSDASDNTELKSTSLSELDPWYVNGSALFQNGVLQQKFTSPCFERLSTDDRLTMKRCRSGVVVFQVNGLDLGVVAPNHQNSIYPFVELNGAVDCIRIVSSGNAVYHPISPGAESLSMGSLSANLPPSLLQDVNPEPGPSVAGSCEYAFSEIHGRNICLANAGTSAKRTASYNQGIVLSRAPLIKGEKFEVRIEKLTKRWNSSIMVGLVCQPTEKNPLPVSALGFRRSAWVVSADTLFVNGQIARSHLPFNLDNINVHSTVAVFYSLDGDFHILINGKDFGKLASDIQEPCYAVIDLYGQCEEVQLLLNEIAGDVYEEKADLDCAVKEKEKHNAALVAASALGVANQKCRFKNLCKQFKSFIGIPSSYFIPEATCYCSDCHKFHRGQSNGSEKNSKEATLIGWCRFQLVLPKPREGTPTSVESQDRWHSAFCPVDVSHVRQLIDAGQLYPLDRLGMCKPKCSGGGDANSKIEETESSQLVFYPSIPSVGGKKGVDFRYKKQLYSFHLAFQLLVQPGSYKVSEHRKLEASSSRRSPTGDLAEYVEWSTKEKGATVLQALLVKVE